MRTPPRKDLERPLKEKKMGRPLKAKYFGNRNVGATPTTDDYGIGGKKISAVAAGNATGYSQGVTVTVSAPQIPTGVQALANISIYTANGNVSSVGITESGSGYTSATATIVKPSNVTVASANVSGLSGSNVIAITSSTSGIYVGMAVAATGANTSAKVTTVNAANVIVGLVNTANISGNATFYDAGTGVLGSVTLAAIASSVSNAITFSSNIGGDTSSADIIRQISSKSFYIQTANGNVGRANLVTTAPVSGEMRITATDSDSGTYYIKKISGHVATVVSGNGTQFTANSRVQWTLDSAVPNVSVKLPSN
jgi:hypothetical protein